MHHRAGRRIERSVIGLRCHLGRNVVIRDSILMGADFYPIAGRGRRGRTPTTPFGSRRGEHDLWGHRRQELPDREKRAHRVRVREPGRRRLRQCFHSRWNHCRAQGGRALRRLAVPPTRLDSIAGPGAPPHPHQGRVKLLKSRPFIYFGSVNAFGSALSSTLNSVIS